MLERLPVSTPVTTIPRPTARNLRPLSAGTTAPALGDELIVSQRAHGSIGSTLLPTTWQVKADAARAALADLRRARAESGGSMKRLGDLAHGDGKERSTPYGLIGAGAGAVAGGLLVGLKRSPKALAIGAAVGLGFGAVMGWSLGRGIETWPNERSRRLAGLAMDANYHDIVSDERLVETLSRQANELAKTLQTATGEHAERTRSRLTSNETMLDEVTAKASRYAQAFRGDPGLIQ